MKMDWIATRCLEELDKERTTNALAKKLGVDQQAVYRRLVHLHGEGVIEKRIEKRKAHWFKKVELYEEITGNEIDEMGEHYESN